MRIAVPYKDGEVFPHFVHSNQFKFYDVADKAVRNSLVVNADGRGSGALAIFLRRNGVEVLICGGIGGAQTALDGVGIGVYPGVAGKADDVVQSFLKDRLATSRPEKVG